VSLFALSCMCLRMRQALAFEPTWFTHSFSHRLRKFVSCNGESRMFCKVGPVVVKTTCWAACSREANEKIQVFWDVRPCRLVKQSKIDYYPYPRCMPPECALPLSQQPASRWTLSWARLIQSTPSHPIYLHIVSFKIILLCMSGSPRRFLPFGLSHLKCVFISLISYACYVSRLTCFIHCDWIAVILLIG